MRLLGTERDFATLFLRLALTIAFFPYGAQKIIGLFSGQGFEPTLQHFGTDLLLPLNPLTLGYFVAVAEVFIVIALFIGFLTRVAAFMLAVEMMVAICLVHLRSGFFLNLMEQQQGPGLEHRVLVIGVCLVLILRGGGMWSTDRAITKRMPKGEIYLPVH